MAIWGTILGGVGGFAVGGPIGALIGAVAGHVVDKARDGQKQSSTDNTKQIAFTIGVIVLGAKMAKADGKVTRDEVQAFKQVFSIPSEEMGNVGKIFDQARKDAGGFEPYAKQLANLFKGEPAVLEELLDGLFHIAKADGKVTGEEEDFLKRCAEIFGFSDDSWSRIRAAQIGPDAGDPYTILGITRAVSDTEIKTAYRSLVRENHPDRLIAQGLPEDFIALANEKLATINAAYDRICKDRGIS